MNFNFWVWDIYLLHIELEPEEAYAIAKLEVVPVFVEKIRPQILSMPTSVLVIGVAILAIVPELTPIGI